MPIASDFQSVCGRACDHNICEQRSGRSRRRPYQRFHSILYRHSRRRLDVLFAELALVGSNWQLHAVMNGTIGTTPNNLYVLGINRRGAGTQNFGSIGLPGVVFDSVVTFTAADLVGGCDLVANTALNLAAFPISVSIVGITLDATISLALLPTQGFALSLSRELVARIHASEQRRHRRFCSGCG